MSAVTDMLATIDAKILALIEGDQFTDYKIGDKTVSRGAALGQLRQLRAEYQDLAEREPFEDIRQLAYEVSDLGVDESEYIGDID